jgi:hypothetical protein
VLLDEFLPFVGCVPDAFALKVNTLVDRRFERQKASGLNLPRSAYQYYQDGNGDYRKGVPMKKERPVPIKHPAEQSAEYAKDCAENSAKYSTNNSEYAADNANDNRKGDDDQDDQQNGRRSAA